jgi:hypothetical protein
MALRPSQFRKYMKDWDKSKYEDKFKEFKERYDGDRNTYRLYIPFTEDRTKSPNEDSITGFLSRFGFAVEDYLSGVARLGNAKNTIKIGKALSNISKRPDTEEKDKKTANNLLKKFGEDPVRKAGGDEFLVCISRHPYDIAGADTDRKWHNCMTIATWDKKKLKELKQLKKTLTGKEEKEIEDQIEKLEGGENVKYIKHDVKEGSIVAYLIRKNDKNINNPVAVLNIKPFINKDDKNDFILVEDSKVYGQDVPGFKEKVAEFLSEFNGLDKEGFFCINPKLYDDGKLNVIKGDAIKILIPDKTKQDKVKKFFQDLFKELKETTSEKYPDRVFFYTLNDDGSKKVWMEQDSENGYLWCRSNGFWSFFENEMGLNYSEIQTLMKTMVEQHLNREVGTPRWAGLFGYLMVEQHLNREVGTPIEVHTRVIEEVEQHLNREVGKPVGESIDRCEWAEQHLNRKV